MKQKGQKMKVRSRVAQPKYNRVSTIKHNRSAKRYDYGDNNLLPNMMLKAIEASVTASSCRERKHEFIEGNGIKDLGIASIIVNPDQTADDLVAELADIVGLFKGLALCVKYNLVGEPRYVYALPFECTRKTDDGRYYVNESLSEGKDAKKDRVYYDEFNRMEEPSSRLARIQAQIEEYGYQTGDIVYSFAKRAGQKDYPVPMSWAGMEEIEADAALGRLDWRNVKKGFRPDAILTRIGEIDDQTEDENGRTDLYYHNKNMEAFMGENAAPILEIEVESKDQVPDLQTFNSEKLLNSTTEAADRIGKRTCRAMGVPEVLIPGFAQPGQLGNVEELKNLLKLFQMTVVRDQRLITRTLEKVFPQFDWTIDPLVLIEELPQWLLDTLTQEEKRILGGYPAKSETEAA